MNANIKLVRIWGIPIGLNNSWFIIFGLVTLSLATNYFPSAYPLLSLPIYITLGLVTSLVFFGSVLAHELGHSLLALRNKIPVRSITLFVFGGIAQIEREPQSPGVEFRIAIAGPLVSLGLSGLFGLTWLLTQGIPYIAAPAEYLMRINLMLALFNLIPGFPLDGGRVLRAIIWKATNDFYKATRVATITGQVVAFGFFAFGALQIFRGQFMDGMWWLFIGWFLQNAASATRSQAKVQHTLQGVTVAEAMDTNCPELSPLTPLSTIIEQRVLSLGQHTFYVTEAGSIIGMLTLKQITAIPKPKWGFTSAYQAMAPFNRLLRIDPGMDLLLALQAMEKADVAEAPVLDAGRLVGTLSRERVVQYLRTRSQLGM